MSNEPYPTPSEEVVGINWEGLSEAFDMPVSELKELHREGTDCEDCGEQLETLGHIIEHDCS